MKRLFISTIFFLSSSLVHGQTYQLEETIVTAEKINQPYKESSSVIEVFEENEIQRASQSNLADFLKRKSSVIVAQNGSIGSSSNLYLRGTESRHTLLIIDGVEYSNPSNIGGEADWSLIPLENVKKIEILKGSQSVLYGSGAIGGVIKITTFKDQAKESQKKVGLSFGSYSTYEGFGSLSIPYKKLHFDLNGQFQRSSGFSSFNAKRTQGADDDGFRLFSLSPRLKVNISSKHELQAISRFQLSKVETDNYGSDNPTSFSRLKTSSYSLIYHFELSPTLKWSSQASFLDSNREEFGEPYNSKKYDLESSLTKTWNSTTLIAGVDGEQEKANDLGSVQAINQSKETYALFYKQDFHYKDFGFDWGARFSNDSIGGNQVTYRLGSQYFFKSLDAYLKAQFTTGFLAPSLYQVYSTYGSSNLESEKSKQYQLSWLQNFSKAHIELSLFQVDYTNLISFNSMTSRYYNEGRSQVRGLELGSRVTLHRDFYTTLSFNLLRAYNEETGEYLNQRPQRSAKLGLGWFINEKMELELLSRYIGPRNDFNNVVLGGYSVFDMVYSYHINQTWFLNLYLYNLFDRDYERVFSYGTRGRSFKLSIVGSF